MATKSDDAIRAHCDAIDDLTQQIRNETFDRPPLPGNIVRVSESDDLQAALTSGGVLLLETGAAFDEADGFTFAPDFPTAVVGLGENDVRADHAPAFVVPVGADRGAVISRTRVGVTRSEVAVRVGQNDSGQTTIEQAPRNVVLHAIQCDHHRGKRAFEINGRDVSLINCVVEDLYDPERQDSQAVWIGNAPGPVRIEGGYFEASSENLLVGGDSMKIPNCRPTGITIRATAFTKPIAWRDDPNIPVKNLIELKDGHDVLIEGCVCWNCWKSGQSGYGLMFTPASGGSLRNVVVRDCRVYDVGGVVNITGTDAAGINTERTQVAIYGGDYRTNVGAMGGSGLFCLIARGPEHVIVEGAVIVHEKTFIDCSDSAPIDLLRVVGCTWNWGTYGIRINGQNNGDNSQGVIRTIQIESNTISGAPSAFRERYPHNTYVE